MKFCSDCGAPVTWMIPPGDQFPRHVCTACQTIHYSNPKVVVGCIPEWSGQVLLCRRAIAPREGFWTMPAGFMENGESVRAGAARETLEESCAVVQIDDLMSIVSIPTLDQVHLVFRGRMQSAYCDVTSESSEVRLFGLDEIPWTELAFRSVTHALEHYLADHRSGHRNLHLVDLGASNT